MDEPIDVLYELNADAWNRLQDALANVTPEESGWRPLPEANTIGVIVRHLRIEAAWHVKSLRDGAPMPTIAAPVGQAELDAIPLDFAVNVSALTQYQSGYLATLRASTIATLRERTRQAYGDVVGAKSHFIAYHNAIHLTTHCGQIRMLRNLYRRTRGESALFVPENPTYLRTR